VTGVVRHPWGPRIYVAGRRVHHGSAGVAIGLLGLVSRNPLLGVAGLAMVADDISDFPWRDSDNHAPAGATA
jgi:hypothetical protein